MQNLDDFQMMEEIKTNGKTIKTIYANADSVSFFIVHI